MAEDLGRGLAQLGASIGEAFTAPAEMRLKLSELKRQREQEEKEGEAKRMAAELVGRTYGPEAQALYEAGESLTGISSLMKTGARLGLVKGKTQAALNTKNKTNKDRYNKLDDFGNMISKSAYKQMEDVNSKFQGKYLQAQTDEEREQIMQEWNSQYDAFQSFSQERMATYVGAFRAGKDKTEAVDKMLAAEEHISNMSPESFRKEVGSVMEAIPKTYNVDKSVLDRLEQWNDENYLQAGVDLSGVPSVNEMVKYGMVEGARGEEMNKEQAIAILNEDDERVLAGHINSPQSTEAIKNLAAAKLKHKFFSEKILRTAVPAGEKFLKKSRVGETFRNVAPKEPEKDTDAIISDRFSPKFGF